MKKAKDIDEYIDGFPADRQKSLLQMRSIIKSVAPKAEEVISYGMPAFKQNGVLVWFAGNKNHIGFYPSSSPIRVFKNELITYKTSKGAIQFSFDKSLPVSLIKKIVRFRMKEIASRDKKK